MPFPIAHSSIGLAGYLALKQKSPDSPHRQELFLLGLCAFLAILPDMDFIPGFICGQPGKFHHGPSHSIVICLISALICYTLVSNRLNMISGMRIFYCTHLAILSHPILDFFSEDTSMPLGIPLLWPFDVNYYISPLSLFQDVQRIEDTAIGFFASLFNTNNCWGILSEILFAGIILFAVFGFKNCSRPLRLLSSLLMSLVCGLLYYLIQIRSQIL